MPLQAIHYHETELLEPKGGGALFPKQSDKLPVLQDVRAKLEAAKTPAIVSIKKSGDRLLLNVTLKRKDHSIEELPDAVKAIEDALKEHKIGFNHYGWSPKK
jgi:hypothetical protein